MRTGIVISYVNLLRAGKLITGAKILCPPSTESFHLIDDELIPTSVEEEESEEEEEHLEDDDVTELESAAELDDESEPMKASS